VTQDPKSSRPAAAAGEGGSPRTSADVWRYARTITIDTTAAGANVPDDVENHPLAVLLEKSRFDFSQARADGADIRFFDAAGKALPHAIELWDRESGSAAIWVLLDVVKGISPDQSISASATRRSISAAGDSGTASWTRRASCRSPAAAAGRSSTTRASGRRRRS
jgi:hypothetical protein